MTVQSKPALSNRYGHYGKRLLERTLPGGNGLWLYRRYRKKSSTRSLKGREWTSMLNSVYSTFHDIEKDPTNADRPTWERILGKDPGTGRTLLPA